MDERRTTIEVRKANVNDHAGILACLEAAFKPYRSQYTSEGFADTVVGYGQIERRMRHMQILVAIEKGPISEEIVGTISYEPKPEDSKPRCLLINETPGEKQAPIPRPLSAYVGHIRGMAVLPSHLGRGIAEELLSIAEEGIREQGCTRVTLDTTEPLKRAQRFYEKHGYLPTGIESDFYGMRLIELEKKFLDL
jgi:ribosomal protein S18 acetylase RimI-like enzyme